jgi:hypothetical protein
MITVLLMIMVLSLMAVTSLSFATGSLHLSRRDQDWNAALAAAEAGIDDYVLHLNQDGNYWTYSSSVPPPDGNRAFVDWVPLAGPTNPATFRYTADASSISTDGNVRITSTGRVRNVRRSVSAIVRRRNFLDYLYFTDYETFDPASYPIGGSSYDAATAQVQCSRHLYETPTRGADCRDIVFFGDASRKDVVNGPLHTNDSLKINGVPEFLGPASTSWDDPAGKRWVDTKAAPGSSPVWSSTGDPTLADPLTMPPSNASLKSWTDPAQGKNGCLFTGPTKITLNSNGTATIVSPYTRTSNCFTQTGIPNSTARTVNVPTDRVFYVQSIPTSSADPNYTAACSGYPPGILPVTGDTATYRCRDGDAFLSGQLSGQLTIASANNIILIGDTTYVTAPPGGTDVLGLIADNYVEMYHPVDSNGNNIAVPLGTPKVVHAAILSVNHSFRVQQYSRGAFIGNLSIRGAIGQKYRGAVGTFGSSGPTSGYIKDYAYDQRLKYISPPHFLDPVKSAWIVKTFAEIKPQY